MEKQNTTDLLRVFISMCSGSQVLHTTVPSSNSDMTHPVGAQKTSTPVGKSESHAGYNFSQPPLSSVRLIYCGLPL